MDETRVLEQLTVVAPDVGRQQELREKLQALFSSVGEKRPYVSGRELHDFLEVNTQYRDWSRRMINMADLTENTDFVTSLKFARRADGTEMPNPETDHLFTLNACKEIATIQRSDLGKLVRRYLIWAEEQFRYQNLPSYQIEDPVERARRWANEQERLLNQVAEREATIEAMTPAANLGNAVSSTPACITVKELAHLITQNGTKIGQNRLFDWLVENDYIYETGRNYKVYQKYLERGLFRVQEEIYNPAGTEIEKIHMKVMITGKGQDYFLDLFKNN